MTRELDRRVAAWDSGMGRDPVGRRAAAGVAQRDRRTGRVNARRGLPHRGARAKTRCASVATRLAADRGAGVAA